MKLSSALLAVSFGLAAAHGHHEGQHVPKLVGGRRFFGDMRMRQAMAANAPSIPKQLSEPAERQGSLGNRQIDDNTDGQCGAKFGSCAPGYCCSSEGWCGKTPVYCNAPDCQINYGSGCDGNKKPTGEDTFGVPRPKLGTTLYGGAGIYECVKVGDIALTFDDGPYLYTNDLLDKLKSYGAKATFFITGNNIGKGMINDPNTIYPAIIRRMHAEGHQIASHTWSHENASLMTNTQFTNQMVWNEIAINSILGFFPTYMRPPYSICGKNCENILSTLGYHTIYFDLDTAGYLNDTPKLIQNSKDIWDQAMKTSDPSKDSFLQIEHDIHTTIVHNLTDYILTSLFSNGYRAVTVGECLGDPPANWYRAGPSNSLVPTSVSRSTSRASTSTSTSPTRTTISVRPTGTGGASKDGTCGNGVTCAGTRFGACCSIFGYCGTGDDYCLVENGCQTSFGSCEGIVTSPTSTSRKLTLTYAPVGTSPAQPLAISSNGQCGAQSLQTCTGSTFGACCGPSNQCATNTISCLSILGCQKDYGYCI
ncbi:hypothetical protein B0T25DRAFT_449731 [Lasiosphaeria hispida]|uniref:Carbohydrate esterase family 4 protein n=1 Tax=Lasiosphaeria hispida TaxID=260671 RepID=A0AAJ0MGF2_9PEZI|nr:hypothetical protein B0T25DRAFT_449731 [Lasiosphaeria hispida]